MHLIYNELAVCNIRVDKDGHFDRQMALRQFDRFIQNNSTKVHTQIYKLMNPNNLATVSMTWFKKVGTMKVGENFGEIAL